MLCLYFLKHSYLNKNYYLLSSICSAPFWTARVEDPKNCLLPLGYTQDQVESCDIYYAACRPLGNACGQYINSTSCQKVVANNTDYYFDMGAFNPEEKYQSLGEWQSHLQLLAQGVFILFNTLLKVIMPFTCLSIVLTWCPLFIH